MANRRILITQTTTLGGFAVGYPLFVAALIVRSSFCFALQTIQTYANNTYFCKQYILLQTIQAFANNTSFCIQYKTNMARTEANTIYKLPFMRSNLDAKYLILCQYYIV